jgi:hypothetical protein
MDYISCGARELYRDGGFYEDSMLIEQLAREAVPEVRILKELFPAYSYVRRMPACIEASASFRDKLLAYYEEINGSSNNGASCVLAELSNAVMANNVLYVQRGASRRIVYETCRSPDRPWSPLLPADAPLTEFPVEADTLYFLLSSVGSFNYGHWLLDDVARLRALLKLRSAYPRHRIVVLLPTYSGGMEPTLRRKWDEARPQALARLFKKVGRCEVAMYEVDTAYSFRQLFYATPISYHPVLKSREALAWLTKRLTRRAWRFRLGRGRSRLLVMRHTMRGRRVENMDSVRSLLEGHGFRSIDPEELSIADQAVTFARAGVVVGVMGASMSNTVFCRPGTRVIHLAPEGWMEPFYWDLAAVRKHRYAACYGPALSAGPPHESSFQVPEESLLRVLQALR